VANIDVVPKKSGAGWMMWLVVALVALVVMWFLMRSNQPNQTGQLNPPSSGAHVASMEEAVAI
jgi:hypothetical protein